MSEKVDVHRKELIINFRDMILGNSEKDYVIAGLSEIENILIKNRDDRFTEEQMLKGLKGFLRKEKGITRMRSGLYEITKELQL